MILKRGIGRTASFGTTKCVARQALLDVEGTPGA